MAHHLVRPAIVATAALVCALALATPVEGRWVIRGKGFGHGAGLSQYGAQGYGQHGRGYRWIIDHYYRHTTLGNAADRPIKVLLDAGDGQFAFTGAKRACGSDLQSDRDYRFNRNGDDVLLERLSGRRLANCGTTGSASGGRTVVVPGHGRYRGKIKARVWSGSGLLNINVVGIDRYARGVVPNEMPASWTRAALRAQAVVARSYALATAGDGPFDVYDDTRSQVYGGADSETAPTNDAVRDTAGEVVRHDGQIATTYFFSTSGGMTENKEFAFPGSSPAPYLKAVRDPFDDISPYHRWRRRMSNGEMESHLSGLFAGRLRRITVVKRGVSPRIVTARVVGSNDSSRVSGPTLQARLGLLSTWARFEKR